MPEVSRPLGGALFVQAELEGLPHSFIAPLQHRVVAVPDREALLKPAGGGGGGGAMIQRLLRHDGVNRGLSVGESDGETFAFAGVRLTRYYCDIGTVGVWEHRIWEQKNHTGWGNSQRMNDGHETASRDAKHWLCWGGRA